MNPVKIVFLFDFFLLILRIIKMKKDKIESVLHELYRRAYAASTPPANWDLLLKNATLNKWGQKEVPYMEHYCSQETLDKIINEVFKEKRVLKIYREGLKNTFLLGASPTSTKKENE
jgi:hypothetical protein